MVSISPVFLYCFYFFFFACALTRQRACCPCDLQVVAARVRVHVNDFPGEIQPADFPAFHRRRVDFTHIHAAAGDDGFLDGR